MMLYNNDKIHLIHATYLGCCNTSNGSICTVIVHTTLNDDFNGRGGLLREVQATLPTHIFQTLFFFWVWPEEVQHSVPLGIFRIHVCSVAETELTALCLNINKVTRLCLILEKLGHPQPATSVYGGHTCLTPRGATLKLKTPVQFKSSIWSVKERTIGHSIMATWPDRAM